nr:MAG: hypothetical protein [Betatorquevirus sp.]
MSDYIKPTLYNGKGLENQLKNLCYNAHDLCCGCQNPTKHLQHLFTEKWLPTTATTKEDGENTLETVAPEDGFDAGDLERIFALEEEKTG